MVNRGNDEIKKKLWRLFYVNQVQPTTTFSLFAKSSRVSLYRQTNLYWMENFVFCLICIHSNYCRFGTSFFVGVPSFLPSTSFTNGVMDIPKRDARGVTFTVRIRGVTCFLSHLSITTNVLQGTSRPLHLPKYWTLFWWYRCFSLCLLLFSHQFVKATKRNCNRIDHYRKYC